MTSSPNDAELALADELNAWADEAQAIIDAGDMPENETRKAKTCVALLREAARATRRDEPVAWRPVVGFEELYEVSSNGDVRSLKTRRILSKPLAGDGYAKAELWKNNNRTQTYVHRLVARAFIGEPPTDRPEINHKDGDKLNNAASNLEWVSRSENVRHAMYELGALVKPVIATDPDSGIEERYPSIEEAGRLGYIPASIYKCLNGLQKLHGGKSWRFATIDVAHPAASQGAEAREVDIEQEARNLRAVLRYIEETTARKFDPSHVVTLIALVADRLERTTCVPERAAAQPMREAIDIAERHMENALSRKRVLDKRSREYALNTAREYTARGIANEIRALIGTPPAPARANEVKP